MNDRQAPPPLTDASRQLLALNRQLHDIPEPVFHRGLRRFSAEQRTGGAAGTRRIVASVGVAFALAAAVLLAFSAPRMLEQTGGQAPAPQAPYEHGDEATLHTSERPSVKLRRKGGQRAVPAEPAPAEPAPAEPAPAEPAPAEPAPAVGSVSKVPSASRAAPLPKPTVESTLAEERAVLALAADALADKRYADARAKLDAHRRRFPAGALASERDALRAIVGCELGEAGAARIAADFLVRHPAALMAGRVRTRCAIADEAVAP